MNLFAAALALLRGGDSPARIGAGRPAVALPFAPPLGQPIRYRYDSTRQRNGMDQITRADAEMVLVAADHGFRADWTNRALTYSARGPSAAHIGPMLRAMNHLMSAGIGRPMRFELDHAGAIIGLGNIAEWRAEQNRLLQGLTATAEQQFADLPDAGRAALAAVMTNLARHYQQQDDAQFIAAAGETPAMILHGGLTMPAGVALVDQITQPARLGDLDLDRTLRLRLDINRTGQWARLHMTATSDSDAVGDLVGKHLAALLEGTGIDGSRAAGPIRLTETATQLIALPSGLVQRATWQRRLAMPGRTHRLETRNIRRLE